MYRRYYDSYGCANEKKDCGEIIIPEKLTKCDDDPCKSTQLEAKSCCEPEIKPCCEPETRCKKGSSLLPFSIDTDDLILIGILIFLLLDKNRDDDDDDSFIYIILGIILLSDIF